IIEIPVKERALAGILATARDAKGVVWFAYGGASGRFSPRNQFVSERINPTGFSTLLFDLLTGKEKGIEHAKRHQFDSEFLAKQLVTSTDGLRDHFKLFEVSLEC
ncbi:MAG: alpha/beta hydrolase, partial [Candidatus Omnitrophica bacterium]|nr:alpha/beta hydrolase [Candidatus Omnitrophota bacterium]